MGLWHVYVCVCTFIKYLLSTPRRGAEISKKQDFPRKILSERTGCLTDTTRIALSCFVGTERLTGPNWLKRSHYIPNSVVMGKFRSLMYSKATLTFEACPKEET